MTEMADGSGSFPFPFFFLLFFAVVADGSCWAGTAGGWERVCGMDWTALGCCFCLWDFPVAILLGVKRRSVHTTSGEETACAHRECVCSGRTGKSLQRRKWSSDVDVLCSVCSASNKLRGFPAASSLSVGSVDFSERLDSDASPQFGKSRARDLSATESK